MLVHWPAGVAGLLVMTSCIGKQAVYLKVCTTFMPVVLGQHAATRQVAKLLAIELHVKSDVIQPVSFCLTVIKFSAVGGGRGRDALRAA